MCGIAGFFCPDKFKYDDATSLISKMTDVLRHRGPDAMGIWLSSSCEVAFGHRRLSILDLSDNGKQPMQSRSGRYIITFNGEIYNHLELREEISDYKWVGHSDTETILAAIESWGIKKSLQRFVGMFAFAIWDTKEKKLFLARDRMGEKPLYYGIQKGVFTFASELKALKVFDKYSLEVDREAVALYLRYGYVPAPYSIYKNIKKLLPGNFLVYSEDCRGNLSDPISFWSLSNVYKDAKANPFNGSFDEGKEELRVKLESAVKLQTISDVQIGAFLSGGIDSSLIVSALQFQLTKPLKTFTVGFDNERYNEAPYAKLIADYLKTDHTELYVGVSDLASVIPDLQQIYDEPFGDSSQLPTLLISRLIKKHVSVAMSGDGGDEFYCGYRHCQKAAKFYYAIKTLPIIFQQVLSGTINSKALKSVVRVLDLICLGLGVGISRPIEQRVSLLSHALADNGCIRFYQAFLSQWPDGASGVSKSLIGANCLSEFIEYQNLASVEEKMMAYDSCQYLPDDILAKVDRASMYYGLETRVPFLDHRLVEFSARLPLEWKFNDGVGKVILKSLLSNYLPNKLFDRPKKGFAVPVDMWLRGPLRDWAEALIDKKKIENHGYINYDHVKKKWDEHIMGHYNWRDPLWIFFMLQSWLDNEI